MVYGLEALGFRNPGMRVERFRVCKGWGARSYMWFRDFSVQRFRHSRAWG